MRSIDIHAHITPQCFWKATEDGGSWHTLKREQDARGRQYPVIGGRQHGPLPRHWARRDTRTAPGVVELVQEFVGLALEIRWHLERYQA